MPDSRYILIPRAVAERARTDVSLIVPYLNARPITDTASDLFDPQATEFPAAEVGGPRPHAFMLTRGRSFDVTRHGPNFAIILPAPDTNLIALIDEMRAAVETAAFSGFRADRPYVRFWYSGNELRCTRGDTLISLEVPPA